MSNQVLVFDFGNVLGMFSHFQAARQISAFCSFPLEKIRDTLFDIETEERLERGEIPPDHFRQIMRSKLDLNCDDQQFDHAFSDMFTPNQHVCDLIPLLAKKHRLLLLSNTNWFHANRFKNQFQDTLAHFDTLILSHEVGHRKPSTGIYHALNQMTSTRPEECIFIDDLASNIRTALECGWQGIVYQQGDSLPDHLLRAGVTLEA